LYHYIIAKMLVYGPELFGTKQIENMEQSLIAYHYHYNLFWLFYIVPGKRYPACHCYGGNHTTL